MPNHKATARLDALEEAVIDRLKQEPASFQDLMDEGLLNLADAASMRRRLLERGLIERFGYRKNAVRGRPRILWRIKA